MHTPKRRWQFLILVAGMALGGEAAAHSDEHLATVSPAHGGVLRMAGALHLELVLESSSVRVYLSDHAFQPVGSRGATGSATVSREGKRMKIPLRPSEGNLLTGKGSFDIGPDTGVTVRVTLPGKKTETAEFPPAHPNSAAETQFHRHETR